tara:strand:- start:44 stop:412 length:369 start_codon:yes stop_codon:yes gene_type:complete
MSTYLTYTVNRYETAKKLLTNAVENNKSVYLMGRGGNGKTTLIQEVHADILEKKYRVFQDPPKHDYLLRKSIYCVQSPEQVKQTDSKNTIVINMNKLYYGKYNTKYDHQYDNFNYSENKNSF